MPWRHPILPMLDRNIPQGIWNKHIYTTHHFLILYARIVLWNKTVATIFTAYTMQHQNTRHRTSLSQTCVLSLVLISWQKLHTRHLKVSVEFSINIVLNIWWFLHCTCHRKNFGYDHYQQETSAVLFVFKVKDLDTLILIWLSVICRCLSENCNFLPPSPTFNPCRRW